MQTRRPRELLGVGGGARTTFSTSERGTELARDLFRSGGIQHTPTEKKTKRILDLKPVTRHSGPQRPYSNAYSVT